MTIWKTKYGWRAEFVHKGKRVMSKGTFKYKDDARQWEKDEKERLKNLWSLLQSRYQTWPRAIQLAVVGLGLGLGAGLLLTELLGVEGLTRKVLVLQASMPVGVLNYLFAQRYGRSPEQVASLVLVSTLLSVVSIPLLLAWL